MRRSSREKHSFIQFYFDDWKAGTAHMTRLVRSVYFDICMHQWDKRQSVSRSAMKLMLGDIPEWAAIVDALVDTGFLERAADDGVWSPRALREGERAFAAWAAKSKGGKAARGGGTVESKPHDSCKSGAAMLEDTTTDSDSDSDSDSEKKKGDSSFGPSRDDLARVVEAWNGMAEANDLSCVRTMTEKRIGHLKVRIRENGINAVLEAIGMIPQSSFLLGRSETGWKANFDWFLQPSSFTKLLEGGYARGKGKASAWTE